MKEDTDMYSTEKDYLPLPLLLIPVVITMFFIFSGMDKEATIRKAYIQTIKNNCSDNENSYSCYNTKFNQPIVFSHRNRYVIKEQSKKRELLNRHKINFNNCLNNYKKASNIDLNKCHNSLTLFQDDIKDKTIEKKLIKYQKNNIKQPLVYFRQSHFNVYIKKTGRR